MDSKEKLFLIIFILNLSYVERGEIFVCVLDICRHYMICLPKLIKDIKIACHIPLMVVQADCIDNIILFSFI